MSRGLNRVMLIGNLGRDPEVKTLPNGTSVARFSLATSESWKNKEGKQEERTEWHKIVAFGKLADICKEYLKMGKQVFVEGRIQTRKWQDQSGADKYMTEIIVRNMLMLGSKGEAPADAAESGGGDVTYEPVGNEEDIPF